MGAAKALPKTVKRAVAWLSDAKVQKAIALDASIVRDLLRGKVAHHYGPIVRRLMGKAYFENNSEVAVAVEAMAAE